MVLDAVRGLKSHATAEEIYQFVKKDYPNISKGTVYRNLNQLVERGDIQKVELPGDMERYDHICGQHYHIKCVRCGRIFDADMEIIKDLESRLKDRQGFLFLSHDIIFRGVCPQCQEKAADAASCSPSVSLSR